MAPTSLWKEVQRIRQQNVPGISGIIEIDKYKNEISLNRKDDPLQYWTDRKFVYPRLYYLICKQLSIPTTSIPCERILSKTGVIFNERRNRLKGEKVKQIVFLKHNQKFC